MHPVAYANAVAPTKKLLPMPPPDSSSASRRLRSWKRIAPSLPSATNCQEGSRPLWANLTDLDHRVRAPARPSLACGLFGPVPCAWPSILYSHMMSKAPGLPLEAPPPEIANRSFGTILIVEDDPHGVIALARVVLVQGFEIRTAATVQEALVALKDDPSGLIVDLGLPDGSGFDFVKAARKESPKMPVLIVTGRLIDHKT